LSLQQDTSVTHELGNQLRALRTMRACIVQLYAADIDVDHGHALVELTVTLRLHIVTLLTHITVTSQFRVNSLISTIYFYTGILDLDSAETWRLQAHDVDYTRTQLPQAFESHVCLLCFLLNFILFLQVTEVLPVLRQVLAGGHFSHESELCDKSDHVNDCMQRLLVSFTHTLTSLVRLPGSCLVCFF
jgi:hypothetical protein